MEIKIGEIEYKLSKAQERVVQILLDNRGNEDVFIIPKPYYNHQHIMGVGKYGEQFKKPTLDWLVKRDILVSNGTRNYLRLNPLAHRIFNKQ